MIHYTMSRCFTNWKNIRRSFIYLKIPMEHILLVVVYITASIQVKGQGGPMFDTFHRSLNATGDIYVAVWENQLHGQNVRIHSAELGTF